MNELHAGERVETPQGPGTIVYVNPFGLHPVQLDVSERIERFSRLDIRPIPPQPKSWGLVS